MAYVRVKRRLLTYSMMKSHHQDWVKVVPISSASGDFQRTGFHGTPREEKGSGRSLDIGGTQGQAKSRHTLFFHHLLLRDMRQPNVPVYCTLWESFSLREIATTGVAACGGCKALVVKNEMRTTTPTKKTEKCTTDNNTAFCRCFCCRSACKCEAT